jgi:hypothetical protein
MRISPKAFGLAFAIVWGGGVACSSFVHLIVPSYAAAFLAFVSSIYPGFHGARSFADALVGTVYALLDGGIGGLFFAWLYNQFLPRSSSTAVQH